MTEEEKRVTLHIGDCLEVMSKFEANSIDAIVSDPPYGLAFMGKEWDHGVPGVDFWTEAHRVAKPGAHLLAFGGTRTYHRLAVAIEDAGWEIRDCVMWVYGGGFPKSLDVSKAIDKEAGAEREKVRHVRVRRQSIGGTEDQRPWAERTKILGYNESAGPDPVTPEARAWQGWGTALKPAWEPIIVARKPLEGTVAENVLKYGTGAINIGECRVGDEQRVNPALETKGPTTAMLWGHYKVPPRECIGRWPANVIHDGSEEVVEGFPDNNGGSAARFFYCAKASKADRNDGEIANNHPTVKPTDLMRYLVRLVTPDNGIVLDPFMGSGSTGKAAVLEGFKFVGIDLSDEYVKIAAARIAHAENQGKNES